MKRDHHRRSVRLPTVDYSQPGWYFVTICTKNRECVFGEVLDRKMEINEFGKIVEKFWFSIPKRYSNVIIDEFVVMPNHFHGLLKILHGPVGAIHELPLPCGNEPNPEIWKQRRRMLLPKIIGYFKMNTAKQINIVRNFNQIPVWQRNYYENIIHSESEVDNIRGYIRNNPRNWENDENNPHGRSL